MASATASPAIPVTIGTANGLSISSQVLSLDVAIAGGASGALTGADKTKLDALTGTNTGNVTIGTANGLSLSGQALSLAAAIAGGASGALTGADKTKLDAISGTNTGDQTTVSGNAGTATRLATPRAINGVDFDGTAPITIVDSAAVVANGAITGATKTKVTYDTKGLITSGTDATTADIADSSNKRYVTDAQQTVIGNTSGTNSGNVTIGTANGLSLSGQVLSLAAAIAAGASGALTGADKTKLDAITGTNTGDVTLAAVGSAPDANGATISGQVLTLQPADATHPGLLTIGTQTIAGAKTFSSLLASSIATGNNAVSLLDGARLNLSTADASAYFSRTATNVIETPGTVKASVLTCTAVVGLNMAATGRVVWGGGNYISNNGSTGCMASTAGWEANIASGSNAYKMLDGSRVNLSTADASAYLARNAANVINTPGKLTATAGLGVGNSAAATALGVVTKKMEVFDATGTSLGFVAIYDAII